MIKNNIERISGIDRAIKSTLFHGADEFIEDRRPARYTPERELPRPLYGCCGGRSEPIEGNSVAALAHSSPCHQVLDETLAVSGV
ncbi:hypothetical protein ACQPXM_06475 [Kribbella sp. CA-253562]|uniref:hypothetical protein n=1 Tax=Kribbella sp. CA-253562 TaxID=3239942 RepID=UPI003D8AFEB7